MGARPSEQLRYAVELAEQARDLLARAVVDRWRGSGEQAYARRTESLVGQTRDLAHELQEAAELARAHERALDAAVPGTGDPQ